MPKEDQNTEPGVPGDSEAVAEAKEKGEAARADDRRAARATEDTSGPGTSGPLSPRRVVGADKENTDVRQRQRTGAEPPDADENVEGTAKHDADSADDTVERDSDHVTVDPTTGASGSGARKGRDLGHK